MEMRTCKKCGELKPITSFERRGQAHRHSCFACVYKQKEAKRDPEERREYARRWRAANPDRVRAYTAKAQSKYRDKHPSKVKASKERYRASDKGREREATFAESYRDKHRSERNEYKRDWMKRNKHRVNAATAGRNAAKRKATPAWANEFFICEAYHLAQVRSQMTGFLWSVDHMVPIVSKLVCGLHVEHNLRVIPHEANRRKNNRYWPDMP